MSGEEKSGFGNPYSAILATHLMAGGMFLLLLAGSDDLSLDSRSSQYKSKTNV